MNLYIKQQYKTHLIDYLKQEYNLELKNLKNAFTCPICGDAEVGNIYPNNNTKFYCISPECSFEGDLFDLIRKTKNSNLKDEKIADYLNYKYKWEIKNDITEILKLYEKNNFCLFPLEPTKDKRPQKGFMWKEKDYRNKEIWKSWIERGYFLAIKLGKPSNIIAIDIDSDETWEKIKDLIPEDTLIQTTKRGKHIIFIYDEAFDNISHANLRSKGYDMELRANNAYIAVAPSSCEGEIRRWNNKKIKKIPNKLKDFLLNLIDKNTKSPDEEIQDAINGNDLGIKNGLVGLDGECNDTFIKLGGKLRKKLNIDNTKYALSIFNQTLAEPMDTKSINGMIRQLDKYDTYDKKELAEEVLERLQVIKSATAFQIAGSLKKEIKDVEDVLKYLEDENKVVALGNRKYQLVNEVEWTTDTSDLSIPVDFEVPIFHNYGHFDWQNMIIIGGASGTGKTTLTGNLIKQFADQHRQVHLINTEAGSKIGKITDKLGVQQGSYKIPKYPVKHPMDIELVDNSITIIDWLSPKDGDYAQMENTYKHLHEQLKIHNAFLIVLTQLRKSNNKFFAEDLVYFYGACVAKYLFGNNGQDAENTLFQVEKLRDSKTGQQYFTIPTHFDRETKILSLRQ